MISKLVNGFANLYAEGIEPVCVRIIKRTVVLDHSATVHFLKFTIKRKIILANRVPQIMLQVFLLKYLS